MRSTHSTISMSKMSVVNFTFLPPYRGGKIPPPPRPAQCRFKWRTHGPQINENRVQSARPTVQEFRARSVPLPVYSPNYITLLALL
jgi:hypothetical protein